MRMLIAMGLLLLFSGCAATGDSCGCCGPGKCGEAKQQMMRDAMHNRAY